MGVLDRQAAQVPPELSLGIGHSAAQGARPGDLVIWTAG
jgi:hypothetical protein